MTDLKIKVFTQDVYDLGTASWYMNTTFMAVDYNGQPFVQQYVKVGPTNPSSVPFPTYPNLDTALADTTNFTDNLAALVIAQVNSIIGATTYTTYTTQKIDTAVGAALAGLAQVARTGNYSDLNGQPSIPTLIQPDWNQTNVSALDYIKNKPSTTTLKAYDGTTLRNGAFPIFKSATVSSGVAIFHLTSDGTSSGTALFPNGPIADSVNAFVSDATASYQMSYAFSNSNKTLTVTANKLTTANILTGILGQTSANSSLVRLSVWGY